MKYPRTQTLLPLLVTLLTAPTAIGCETAFEPSTTAPRGYTFAQDLESERRILRLGFSADEDASCMQSALPVNGNVTWRSTMIDSSLYEALIDLAFDDDRIPAYEADTLAIECNDWNCAHDCSGFEGELHEECIATLPEGCVMDPDSCVPVAALEECSPRPNDIDFCYIPEASAAVDNGPWRFALSPDFTPAISAQSQALIDAFLEAHEACWNP